MLGEEGKGTEIQFFSVEKVPSAMGESRAIGTTVKHFPDIRRGVRGGVERRVNLPGQRTKANSLPKQKDVLDDLE